jgi:hypothetical protein
MKTPNLQSRCLLGSLSGHKILSLWLYGALCIGLGCGTNKNATKASNSVAVRSVTYTCQIWVLSKKQQGQKFVQYKEPVWTSTGTPAGQETPPASPGDSQTKK